jgi:anthranilate synthase component 2
LVIDNYDSFTYNLVQMFRHYPLEIKVFRSDQIDLDQIDDLNPDYLLISPGPKDPAHAGISMPLIKAWHRRVPILGVCLGMQCINEVFGGRTVRSPRPLHGKTSTIHHDARGLFRDVPSPFQAARYHSLMIEPDPTALQGDLTITARTKDQVIMGISHRSYPLHGVQFHPESFLTHHGFVMIENFLKLGPVTLAQGDRRIG